MKKTFVFIFLAAFLSICRSGPAYGESAHSLAGEGSELYKQGRYSEAAQKFLAAQVEAPDEPEISYNLGNSYYKAGEFDKAARNYLFSAGAENKALQQKSLYNLGNTFYRQGRLEQSIDYYKKALELNPADSDARKNLEYVKRLLQQRQQQPSPGEEGEKQDQDNSSQQQDSSRQQPDQSQEQDNQQQRQRTDQPDPESTEGQSDEMDGKVAADRPREGSEEKDQTQQAERSEEEMSEEEAQRWMETLGEDKKKYMRRQMLKKHGREGRPVEKDW